PVPPPTRRTCSRPLSQASSQPATSARAQPSAAPPPSAREQWPSSSSTPTSKHAERTPFGRHSQQAQPVAFAAFTEPFIGPHARVKDRRLSDANGARSRRFTPR